MPSKKRKYNARFPAGRIKKIMQTDEEVGKVAQAVPIIICSVADAEMMHDDPSFKVPNIALTIPVTDADLVGPTPRTLELFVESLLKQAMQVTVSRNAKTLSPSHVKQCILAEARFDFLKDLVKNIPDVSAAEEKEIMSGESSPNALRFPDASRRLVREDSNSSSSCDVRVHQSKETLRRAVSLETEVKPRIETVTSTSIAETAIDLTKKRDDPPRMANFYQETLTEVQQRSVITVNPTYNSPQPSTSSFATLTPVQPVPSLEMAPKDDRYYVDLNIRQNNNITKINAPLASSVTPILNIDFSKNFANPEIKVLDTAVANMVGVKNERPAKVQRQNSRKETKREVKIPQTVDIDNINSGNLQIDEDYDT